MFNLAGESNYTTNYKEQQTKPLCKLLAYCKNSNGTDDLTHTLTCCRTVDSEIRFPLTKVLAFSMGVMLTVPSMLVIMLKQTRKNEMGNRKISKQTCSVNY